MKVYFIMKLIFLMIPLLEVVPGFSAELSVDTIINHRIYVDSQFGDDTNSGVAEDQAWKTLDKINNVMFGPGARIYFRAGGIWNGQLKPQGSGESGKPIIIDKYGEGSKPLINGLGLKNEGVVYLYNQSYWEINNLEIINDAKMEAMRKGVEILAENHGVIRHIHLRDLHIHHIKGKVGHGQNGGIQIRTVADDIKDTRFDDILIEKCHIHHVANQGIFLRTPGTRAGIYNHPKTADWDRRKFTNVVIRENTIHHISKNAIVVATLEEGLVERNRCSETALYETGNTIFTYGALNTVMQYNEGFLNRSPGADGSLYDADIGSPGTVWQYSYSHDNAHGLMWFCTHEQDTGIVVRYNLSVNDRGFLVNINFPFKSAHIYNNVFYIGRHVSPVIIRENKWKSHTYSYKNNIVYNDSKTATFHFVENLSRVTQDRTIERNIFFKTPLAKEIDDGENLKTDPQFIAKTDQDWLIPGMYKLQENSPAIHAGEIIPRNGGKDHYGNKIKPKDNISIGIYNGTGI